MDDISPTKLTLYREAFELFDTDKDGSINSTELSEVMKRFFINDNFDISDSDMKKKTEKEVYDQIVSEVDVDENKKIDFEEFVILMHKRTSDSEIIKEDLQVCFKAFVEDPKSDDKRIQNTHLAEILSGLCDTLTREEIDEIIKEADTDNDGYLNYVEFTDFLLNYK